MKILILASNPRKDLNLDDEIRLLRSVIERARDRSQFEIVSEMGVRVGDLQWFLMRHKPQIVHFCGHGGGEEGLIFKMDGGGEQWVQADALANLFGLDPIRSHVKCVLLNACYSEKQADAIVSRIHYVVGMSHAIQDNAAIAFTKGFYLALGEGCSIDDAFEFGRNAIQLEISGSSKKMRSAATEEGVRKAEVVNAIQQTPIPEHLKPTLKCNPTLTQATNPVVSSSEQPLSQAKREEIQLDVAKVLTEKKPELKQFRDEVRHFLQDHRLADYEKDLLDELREDLGLSIEEADRILEEEQEPLRQARQVYAKRLVTLTKYYPFNEAIQAELKKFQSQRNLTDEEVDEISRPILEKAEADYQEKLRQQAQQEYENKLKRYEQEFRKAIKDQYPIIPSVRDGLRNLQQSLGLSDEDAVRIEEPLAVSKEAEYQQHLAEEQRSQEEAKRRLGLERQQALQRRREEQQREYQAKLQQYEQEFAKTIEAEYPIGRSARYRLISFRQSLGLRDTDVSQIEESLIALKEAAHQQHLEQQREQGRQGEQKQEPEIERQRQPEKQRRHRYQVKLQGYDQEFRKAVEARYPLDPSIRDELRKLQQSLKLTDEDVAQIEEPILAATEVAYQQLERQQELERQRQERLKREAAEKQRQAEEEERQRREAERLRQQRAAEAEAARLKQQGLRGNYSQLEALLKAGKWQKADQETAKRMYEVMGRQKKGWLRVEDIERFPCADLREIDRLWVEYSNGRFGFSIQKQIWQEYGSPTAFDNNWEKFAERIGWRTEGFALAAWEPYSGLTFNTSAPQGHLPAQHGKDWQYWQAWLHGEASLRERIECFSSLAHRLVNCSI